MAITSKEAQENRRKRCKRYDAYLPNYLAFAFSDKLKKDNLKYSEWLKINVEKYLEKNWKKYKKVLTNVRTWCII